MNISIFRVIAFIEKIATNINTVIDYLRHKVGPAFLVNICAFFKSLPLGERTFRIGFCEEDKVEQWSEFMRELDYRSINITQATLHSNTTLRLELTGRYQLADGPVELT